MKKYLLFASALLFSILSCSEKEQIESNGEENGTNGEETIIKSEEQLAFEEIETATANRLECNVSAAYFEKKNIGGSQEKNIIQISFTTTGTGSKAHYLYLPSKALPPQDRAVAPGYYIIEEKYADVGEVHYKRGILRVASKGTGQPVYSFAVEAEEMTAVYCGTPETDEIPARVDYYDRLLSFDNTSTTQATYHRAGTSQGVPQYDCLRVKMSYSTAASGQSVEGTVNLLVNKASAGNELAALTGTYKGGTNTGDHIWYCSTEDEIKNHCGLFWYNRWGEDISSDLLLGSNLTASRSAGYIRLNGTGYLASSILLALLGGETIAVQINVYIKESDIQIK